ncbi:hypothetical protein Poly24_24020 [Rosistilla carotiformis]|uniref:DUF1552 domain-containing protein n=1 Tax=Rosistilla carotiformis TaxID=2528017 RepID=A0A518JT20_9BACT|nr:DUF1552 domain-containing protein [Rosistilla carotiformis]QDV68689.1 hypothetical protein Poly24_24020 [Rosistilla carotiformis]
MQRTFTRRSVLRGLGTCLSLPLLDAMVPTADAAPSKFRPLERSLNPQPRMICCYVPNGVNIAKWVPEQAGRDYVLSPTLKALEPHRQDFSVISGLGHPAAKGGHSGADTWLTGADLGAKSGSDYTNRVSADQIAAMHHGHQTRFPSLQLSDSSGTGAAGHSHTLSFDRSGTPIPAENSPRRLFERLFVPDSAEDRQATLRRYALQKSILDNVLAEAKALGRRLGTKDKLKLEQYLASVRETELRVERLQEWIDVPKPEVEPTDLQLASQSRNAHDRPMWIDVMMELSYLAFNTDTTRVITFEWSREAGGFGGGGENHHELSHHGGDEKMLQQLAVIDRFHLDRLARFLQFLKDTDDGDGNMLDRTMIVYGSGMNSGTGGEHSPKNLPLLVAGGHKLGFNHGQHLAFGGETPPPLNNLLLSVIQKMKVPVESFGDSTGTINGLT